MSDDSTPGTGPIEIPESDAGLLAECRVDTFTAGGKGGQHQNRTESGVRLVHLPTGLEASSRRERSQHRNKAIALGRLRARLEALNQKPTPRVPTRVPHSQKRKRLEEKARRAERKAHRRRPPEDEA